MFGATCGVTPRCVAVSAVVCSVADCRGDRAARREEGIAHGPASVRHTWGMARSRCSPIGLASSTTLPGTCPEAARHDRSLPCARRASYSRRTTSESGASRTRGCLPRRCWPRRRRPAPGRSSGRVRVDTAGDQRVASTMAMAIPSSRKGARVARTCREGDQEPPGPVPAGRAGSHPTGECQSRSRPTIRSKDSPWWRQPVPRAKPTPGPNRP